MHPVIWVALTILVWGLIGLGVAVVFGAVIREGRRRR